MGVLRIISSFFFGGEVVPAESIRRAPRNIEWTLGAPMIVFRGTI
jgi:hypothetical protein